MVLVQEAVWSWTRYQCGINVELDWDLGICFGLKRCRIKRQKGLELDGVWSWKDLLRRQATTRRELAHLNSILSVLFSNFILLVFVKPKILFCVKSLNPVVTWRKILSL